MSMIKRFKAAVRNVRTTVKVQRLDEKEARPIAVSGDIGKIKKHLECGDTISSAEAFIKYGTLKLTSRVSDLRKMGMEIKDEWMTNDETGKRFKIYWI